MDFKKMIKKILSFIYLSYSAKIFFSVILIVLILITCRESQKLLANNCLINQCKRNRMPCVAFFSYFFN